MKLMITIPDNRIVNIYILHDTVMHNTYMFFMKQGEWLLLPSPFFR